MPPRGFGITRRFKLIILPLIAAILIAVYVAMDKYYLSEISPDPYAYSFLSMTIGLLSTVIFMLILRIPLPKKTLIGSYIDPNYNGFVIPKGKLLLLLIIAGLSSAVSTLTYFIVVGESSPSLVLPFMQLLIIYLILVESISYRETPSLIEVQSIVMILSGVFIMATSDLTINWLTIVLILGPYNLSLVVFTVALRKAKRMLYNNRKTDSLNLRLWSMAFNTLFITILVIPFITPEFYLALALLNPASVTFIVVVMLISTLAFVAYIRALGITKMSTVTAILSFSIVLAIPLTIIGDLFFPGAFGPIDLTPLFWLFKVIGIVLIIIGIISLGISQVKAYLLISLSSAAEPVITQITKLRGIARVSAVSGNRQLIAELNLRSLNKAYRTLITDLEKIAGIKNVTTLTSLKEWEAL